MVATNPILAYQEYFSTSRIGKTWHAGHGVNSPEIDNLIDSFGKIGSAQEQEEVISELQSTPLRTCHLSHVLKPYLVPVQH